MDDGISQGEGEVSMNLTDSMDVKEGRFTDCSNVKRVGQGVIKEDTEIAGWGSLLSLPITIGMLGGHLKIGIDSSPDNFALLPKANSLYFLF